MTISNKIIIILQYYRAKFNLENNQLQVERVEAILNVFSELNTEEKLENLAPTKKRFSKFLLTLKDFIKVLENPADRRLMRSLISFAIITRRESNKNKSYFNIFNLALNNLPKDSEFNKAKLLSDKKKITLKFPRK